MIFLQPIWLFLLIPIAFILYFRKTQNRVLYVIRCLILLLIILILAGFALKLREKNGLVVVLADRSLSMPHNSIVSQKEIINILQKTKHKNDRITVISFAEKTVIEKSGITGEFNDFSGTFNGDETNFAEAFETAFRIIPENIPSRILILSDGLWTGKNPKKIIAKLAAAGIAVDYRLFSRPRRDTIAIKSIHTPSEVFVNEFFNIQLKIFSQNKCDTEYKLFRNKQLISKGKITLIPGINKFVLQDKSDIPQVLQYSLVIEKINNDSVPENNKAKFLVKVKGRLPILFLTMSPNSSFGKALSNSKINVSIKTPAECDFSLSELSGYSAIVIENTPANLIGDARMRNIAEWIKNAGTGMFITGGENSYGPGGYYKSPLADIMPVSMELRKEHRKLAMSIVVVLDRSGSMAMRTPMGRTKMELADISTCEVLRLLSPTDAFGVIAVDSVPHTIIPLSKVADLQDAEPRIMSIESMGGGIFVYTGLLSAVNMVVNSDTGVKHIILFADASDSEEPGKYKQLLKKCTAAGITVSVIGLGTEHDCDAKFLKDVAARGKGRCFFTDSARELPRLFTQDTFVVARNTFIKQKTKVRILNPMYTLTRKDYGATFVIGGYNLCYAKQDSSVAALSCDEYKAPVLAYWNVNAGRVACYTGEVDGKYTGPFGKWKNAADFLVAVSSWTAGADNNGLPDTMAITQEMKNGIQRIRLHLDPYRKNDPFEKLPILITLKGNPGKPPKAEKTGMAWENADTLYADIPLKGSEVSLSTVYVDKFQPVTVAPVCLPYSPEFEVSDFNGEFYLKKIANMTGGKERINLSGIWKDMPHILKYKPVNSWLFVCVLILFLLEILERKTGLLSKHAFSVLRKIYKIFSFSFPYSRIFVFRRSLETRKTTLYNSQKTVDDNTDTSQREIFSQPSPKYEAKVEEKQLDAVEKGEAENDILSALRHAKENVRFKRKK